MRNDLIRELGPLAFASRLRRLSERLMQDVSKVYADYDSDFEPRWFPVAYLLSQKAAMGVTEIASALGYTHPAVIQIATAMERRGLIRSRKDVSDGRRRLLALTIKGQHTVKRIAPVWNAVRLATEEIINGSGHDALQVLGAIEDQLDTQELLPRIRKKLGPRPDIQIIPFTPTLARHFGRLNREWLGRDVPIEPHDRDVIAYPDREIIARGGGILFARLGRLIVGTVAMIPHSQHRYEISKMAVTEKHRGKGIGRALVAAAVAWARAQSAQEILIATSPKLKRALALYRSMGFVEIAPDDSWKRQYHRKTIFMKLDQKRSAT